jgi:DNA mismatch repair protein MutS2
MGSKDRYQQWVSVDYKYLQTLDFAKILERLSQHTAFSAGRDLVLALKPSPDLEEAQRRQRETSEARKLLEVKTDLSLGGARDVRPLLKSAGLRATLLPTDLLDIRATLISGRTLKRAITRLAAQFPLLAAKASRIEECAPVVAEIGRCINDRGEVVDAASQALARIRRELKEAHERLLDKLNRIVASPANASFLQEPLVTQRGGRYVIPLKADFKGRVPGVVHDQSASGATLFIEPLATVELNNRWRELQLEEEREVERILAGLSALVAEEGAFIERSVQVLAELDLAFAKARYANEIQGVEPQLAPFKLVRAKGRRAAPGVQHPGSTIQLQKARHPLLDPTTVVPIDVHLDDNYFILVITGPNTGGKTVSLKTVGLLGLMAQAGLHIPAEEGSTLSVFHGIYADIGDEQSIEQNLSTFSSHTTNIINILGKADSHSLVLLDELGAGTDPSEGSALARAILSHLLRKRITTLVATHYPELKVYAHATPRVENASVEFDLETLAPTYELSIGLPGRSNAFAIASRLGLAADIVGEAKSLISPEVLETEGLLAEIKQTREDTLAARQAIEEARREAQALEEELRARLDRIEEERREILNAAREGARQELAALKEEIRKIRGHIAPSSILHPPPPAGEVPEQPLAQAAERLAELERRVPPLEPAVRPRPGISEPLCVGDIVWVEGLQASGEVIELDGDEAEVQVGRFRVRARLEELERRVSGDEPPPVREGVLALDVQHPSPGIELNLRGLRVEEAILRLDKYLDDAYLARLPLVRIIHGRGTGALRRAVREQLEGHPLVASYRPGDQHEGGDGVTVAELVSR